VTAATTTRPRFVLPPGRDATEPPEARGLARDEVGLLVARPSGIVRGIARDLPDHLEAGDLLVVNTSATVPSAIDAHRGDGRPTVVHVAGDAPEGAGLVLVELREPDGSGPQRDGRPGERLTLTGGATLRLVTAHEPGALRSRLWFAAPLEDLDLADHLAVHGRPIAYGYLHGRYPLTAYQPVFARDPGSAEMPSAARPFTDRLVTELVTRGVTLAPITLHTGVSSQDRGEPPLPERFVVPPVTARLVGSARDAGRRVVAVGTTVVRALESAVDPRGTVRPRAGWTDLVLGPDRPARVVTGLVTGWHAPEASHLDLLDAVAGRSLVDTAYRAAVDGDERWHEFGDTCLLLP
jgi:S-adenosylmethionine:tRNA ribosyltransferase-isomerase